MTSLKKIMFYTAALTVLAGPAFATSGSGGAGGSTSSGSSMSGSTSGSLSSGTSLNGGSGTGINATVDTGASTGVSGPTGPLDNSVSTGATGSVNDTLSLPDTTDAATSGQGGIINRTEGSVSTDPADTSTGTTAQ